MYRISINSVAIGAISDILVLITMEKGHGCSVADMCCRMYIYLAAFLGYPVFVYEIIPFLDLGKKNFRYSMISLAYQ